MAESVDALADKLREIATEETYLHAYARRRAGDHYDRELIAFDIADECYALGIREVREIVKLRPITEVPRVPAFVKGVITVRGEVIPALDLRERLTMPAAPYGRRTRILICWVRGEPTGLIVDAVRSVVRLRNDQIEGPPQMGGGPETDFIAGIGRDDEELYILLDINAVATFELGEVT